MRNYKAIKHNVEGWMLMAKVVKFDGLGFTALLTNINDETLQNFINKNPIDLENLQRNKKKRKRRIYRMSS